MRSETDCHDAAKLLQGVVSPLVEGNGRFLPFGCVWDTEDTEKAYVYWNSNGSVISGDPNVRQVCM